jgi:hypothetical protein
VESEGSLPNALNEASIILIPKRDSRKEIFWPISPKNIVTEIINNILTNKVQQHIKKIVSLMQECSAHEHQ